MMFRAIIGCAAWLLGVLLSVNVSAAPACDDAECATATAKPLNIMQFMREQAAATRVVKVRDANPGTIAKVRRPPRRAIAAPRKPVPMPAEAAASFAARPDQKEQMKAPAVTADEPTAIDRTADMAPSETMGVAAAVGPDVQLVDAEEFNDIDRKADTGSLSADTGQSSDAQARGQQANTSWRQWLWSAVGSTFAALATALHQLTRL
jgi:hypothetical protein